MSQQLVTRLRWACRRGMLELDLVLLPFLENIFPHLSSVEQEQFKQLLDCHDQDLYRWLIGHEQPADATLATIIERVRKSV